jgi:hypothetical protein
VGTTNLDRGQFVVWDLGAIASLGTEDALWMMRRVYNFKKHVVL